MPTGSQILQLALTRLGDPYVLGALVPKNNSSYHGPWDCAEFTTWLVYQVSSKLYGCARDNGNPASADAYTGFYKRDADELGEIITVEAAAAIEGAFVLRYSGSGLIGHIVVSDGAGGTVEAHSHVDGVIRSHLDARRWDIGILIPWINYVPAPRIPLDPPLLMIYRFTNPLMKGEPVRKIQMALYGLGYIIGVDGIYGSHTYQAVRQFQNTFGLVADGEVGPKTAKALGVDIYS